MTRFSDRIDIVRQIHAGDYFDAYEAVDTSLDRPVFLKVGRVLAAAPGPATIEAHVHLWRELARIRVSGMPMVLDVGRQDDRPFLLTEWITGAPLLTLLAAGPVPVADPADLLRRILRETLRILAELHANGLVHGDVAPSNILIGSRMAGLVVSLVDPAPHLDLPDPADPTRRLIFATHRFLAPEVGAGHPMTTRSDLFALGKVIEDAASRLNADVPHVVRAMTAEEPAERPSSATDALASLDAAPVRMPHPAPAPRDAPWSETKALGGARTPLAVPAPPHPVSSAASSDRTTVLMSIDRRTRWAPVSESRSVPVPSVPATPSAASSAATTVLASVPREPEDWREVSAALSVPMSAESAAAPSMPADFSVIAPSAITAGRNFVVEVWIAPSGQRDEMLAQATRHGRMIERGGRAHIDLARDSVISVILRLPDFEVAEPAEILGWNGDIRNVGFIVKAPAALAPGIYPGAAKLMQGQIPFASIMFDLEIVAEGRAGEATSRPRSAHVQRIAHAFASYASEDRPEVLRRVQGIQAVGTTVFLDIVSLRAGQDWQQALYREIDVSDRLFLFWSRNAARSPWVDREWRYALEQRGVDFIDPLALEDPRLVKPPSELSGKHFNDMLLAFIKAEEGFRKETER